MKIGEYIVKARLSKDMTRDQLSKRTGIRYLTIMAIESGNIEYPEPVLVRKILQVLGKSS